MDINLAPAHPPQRPPRFLLRVPVTVFLDGAVIKGLTRNLSEEGAFLVLDDLGPLGNPERLMGQRLALAIEFPPPWNDVLCEAEVRWLDSGGLGVRFRGLGDSDRQSLKALLAGRTRH